MKQLTQSEVNYLQTLIDSLQYETSKAKDNGGFVSPEYIKEKAMKILKLVK